MRHMIDVMQILLREIEGFIGQAEGMTERRFGLAVANNHKLVPRIRAGHGVNARTQSKIMAFIAAPAGNAAPQQAPATHVMGDVP